MKKDLPLQMAFRLAESLREKVTLPQIKKYLSSSLCDERLLGLCLIRQQILEDKKREEYFDLSKALIDDQYNYCRWQALIVVGEFIESKTDLIWSIIVKYGSQNDEDMRSGVATVLLEHLLEKKFKTYFPKIKKIVKEDQNSNLKDTLRKCWHFIISENNSKKIENLLNCDQS